MSHVHRWVPSPAVKPLGCTVFVREAGPVTNPLCNIVSVVECAEPAAPHRDCPEARCRRHARGRALVEDKSRPIQVEPAEGSTNPVTP